jgi:ribosomal protein S18 acetylase RimI-like enzyme
MLDKLSVIRFDPHLLRSQPKVYDQLARLYCDVFAGEPFNEYRQCPVCNKYFSHDQVELQGISSCSNGHAKSPLKIAWEVEPVKVEIMDQASEPGFCGFLALTQEDLAGFSWARIITFEELRRHWDKEIVDVVQSRTALGELVYFDELGVDPKKRGLGIGRKLVSSICKWAKDEHGELLTLLRTHQNSPARHLFESAGYQKFAQDSEYGEGRIMMILDLCKNLVIR